MEKQTKKQKEQRRKDWEEIIKEKPYHKKIGSYEYMGFMGMLIKMKDCRFWRCNRNDLSWTEIDFLTMQPLKIKGEWERISEDRNVGIEKYGR